MFSKLYVTFLSILYGICSYPVLVPTTSPIDKLSGLDCQNSLKTPRRSDSDLVKRIVQECLTLYPLKDPNLGESIEESQLILDENQNNCALKCINENLNVTTEDGLIDVSKIQRIFFYQTNVTKSYLLKLTSLMRDCERKAGEVLQVGVLEHTACKYHILFMHCYSDAYRESRQELYKLCQESS